MHRSTLALLESLLSDSYSMVLSRKIAPVFCMLFCVCGLMPFGIQMYWTVCCEKRVLNIYVLILSEIQESLISFL